MQLDMFMSEDMQSLAKRVEKVEITTGKVQRGIFARHTVQDKKLIDLEAKVNELERRLYNFMNKVYNENEKVISISREG